MPAQEHRSPFIDPARLIGISFSVLMHDRLLRLMPSKFPISDREPPGHMRHQGEKFDDHWLRPSKGK